MGKNLFIKALLLGLLAVSMDAEAQPPAVFKIEKMPFNSDFYNEISPVIVKDGIIFCSDRRYSGIFDRTAFSGKRLYNFYHAIREDTTLFKEPEIIISSRTYLFNNGPFCFTPDGAMIYFTSETETGEVTKKRAFKNHSGIYLANFIGMNIRSLSPFRYNSQVYETGQPSISSDGKYLFFATDMPGGQGGSDLYYCELVNGEWSAPVNLGPEVNSSRKENYPYIHPSGRLYFASDRPGGFGKLDIYYTSIVNGVWQKPALMPEPVNSSSDDFSLVAGKDLRKGYFASNRGSTDDIYEFTSLILKMDKCDTIQENSYCYRFTEENAVKNDSIPFRYSWKFEDGTIEYGPVVDHCFEGPGTYAVQLDALNLITNEILYNEKTDTVVIKDIEQPIITSPDTVIAGQPLHLNADSTNLPGWNIDLYYWNFGDETIGVGNKVDKIYSVAGLYNVQLIVSARFENEIEGRKRCVSKNILVIRRP